MSAGKKRELCKDERSDFRGRLARSGVLGRYRSSTSFSFNRGGTKSVNAIAC